MAKGNKIKLNFLHLNSVPLNGSKEVQRGSASGGGSIVPIPPSIPTFILTAGVQNGKVTATLDGKTISLPYQAYKGDEIVLSVTPNDGYEFEGWSDGNKSNPRTIVVNEDITLNASCKEIFVPLPTYTLSASVSNGVVSATLNGSAISLPYEANEGDVIVVQVTPNDGYTFEGWADGNTDNPRSITMASDVVLSAECIAVPSENKYIVFEDAEVERVLMSKGVSSDGVGITKEDAERVTNIGTWFNSNTTIQSFDEFAYFTNVRSFSANAFKNCDNLRKITIPSSITTINTYGIFDSCDSLERVRFNGNIDKIGNEMFRSCVSLKDIEIPDSVIYIGNSAFNNCPSLNHYLILPNVIDVGNNAFKGTGIVGIELPKLQTAQYDVFYNASKLKKVDIGASATSWMGSMFAYCTELEAVICRATTPPSSGNNIIAGSNNATIYVPDASLEAYKTATNWNSYAERIHPLSEIEGVVITQNTATDADFFVMYTPDNKTRKYIQRDVSQASSYSMSMSVASGSPIKGCIHIKRSGRWSDNEVDSGWITGGMSRVVTNDLDANRSCPLIGVGFTYVSNNDGVPTMEEIRQYITFQIEIF